MVFNSIDAIKKDIEKKMKVSIHQAQQKVHWIIDGFLNDYYNEFTPEVYIRTHQLLHSLVKSNVKKTGNGFEVEVYFDESALNYTHENVPTRFDRWGNVSATWGAEEVLDTAMHGSHGGYVGGTAIWDRSISILDKQAIDILKHTLQANGIPIR